MLIRLKPLSLALSGAALLTLAACGGGGEDSPTPQAGEATAQTAEDGRAQALGNFELLRFL